MKLNTIRDNKGARKQSMRVAAVSVLERAGQAVVAVRDKRLVPVLPSTVLKAVKCRFTGVCPKRGF